MTIIGGNTQKITPGDICSKKCLGNNGYDGGCCTLEQRDWIIGPLTEDQVEKLLFDLRVMLNRKVERKEAVIDYEEGCDLFPTRSQWQNKNNFPCMRINLSNYRLPCVFYNIGSKKCNIYNNRPRLCKDFFCDYLKQHSIAQT